MSSRLEMLQQLLKEDANDPFLNYALCLEFYKENRLNEVLRIAAELHRSHPDYLPLYYQWALWLIESGKKEDAKKATTMGIAVASQQNNIKIRSELQTLLDQI